MVDNGTLDINNLPHERCNYITKNIILGARPIVETLSDIEKFGVDIFIDLRQDTNYDTEKEKHHFPVRTGRPPSKNQAEKILQIILNNPEKLFYIHCNGGHGRAGTIGAYILGKIYGFDTKEAVEHVEKCRNTRKDKTRNFVPTPETTAQMKFLIREIGLKNGNIAPDRSDMSWINLLRKTDSRHCRK